MVYELWSCGQTGVAHGALLAADCCGLRTGVWMALGFANENGSDPRLAELFHFEAFTRAGELQPIRRNVKESDATLWIAPPPRIETDPAFWVTRKAVATYGPLSCPSRPRRRRRMPANTSRCGRSAGTWRVCM
jgi:hypothetical protein